MSHQRHIIQFPPLDASDLSLAEVYFYLSDQGRQRKIRFHDYAAIYDTRGLYEQLFDERLKCASPRKMADILNAATASDRENLSELRILDLGAGNGMVGEALKRYGAARLVGVDILPAARNACLRDRPGVYDAYYVRDLTDLDDASHAELASWQFDCMVSVAALGFGDIPPQAFAAAYNLIQNDGWVAFNIKESFLREGSQSDFSALIRRLIFSPSFDLHHLERYSHRRSIEGKPLHYFAIFGPKRAQLEPGLLDEHGRTPEHPGIAGAEPVACAGAGV